MNRAQIIIRLAGIYASYRRRDEIPASMPLRLWVETSTRCNLRCPMCPNRELPSESRTIMPMSLFTSVVDQVRGIVNDMYLHHRGEPFTNPALFDMIRTAEAANIRTRFHTNGALMNREKASELLDATPSIVSFSVDGFSKAAYEDARPGAVFENTLDNILFLAAERRRRRQKKPYLVVERIRFRSPHPDENPEATALLQKRFLQAGIDEVIEKEEYDWATSENNELKQPRLGSCCTFPWYAMVICADGTVTACPQDFHARMTLGNITKTSIRDIWHGGPYRALRRALRDDVNSLPLCSQCDRLCRKTVADVPWQYAATFLIDQLFGYGRLRKAFGTAERN